MIIAGDINSWRTKKVGSHAPHNYLTGQGFRDGVNASTDRLRYPTVNHCKRTLKPTQRGRRVALDVVMVKGAKSSFKRYENVMKVVDSSRPSDHNMVLADFTL